MDEKEKLLKELREKIDGMKIKALKTYYGTLKGVIPALLRDFGPGRIDFKIQEAIDLDALNQKRYWNVLVVDSEPDNAYYIDITEEKIR